MTNIGFVRKVYQGWEPILAQTTLPNASSPTTDSTFPVTFNFFGGDSFRGFSSLLQQTSVAAAAFGAEGAAADFEDAGLLDGVSFAVLVLLLTRKALEKVTMMLAAWWTMEMGSLSCSLSR